MQQIKPTNCHDFDYLVNTLNGVADNGSRTRRTRPRPKTETETSRGEENKSEI